MSHSPENKIDNPTFPDCEITNGDQYDKNNITRRNRLQFIFSQESFNRLEDLTRYSSSSSFSDVIKKSFSLYEMLLKETMDGSEISIERKDGKKVILLIK